MSKELSNFEEARRYYSRYCIDRPSAKKVYDIDFYSGSTTITYRNVLQDLVISRHEDIDKGFKWRDPKVQEFLDGISQEYMVTLVNDFVRNWMYVPYNNKKELLRIIDTYETRETYKGLYQ